MENMLQKIMEKLENIEKRGIELEKNLDHVSMQVKKTSEETNKATEDIEKMKSDKVLDHWRQRVY